MMSNLIKSWQIINGQLQQIDSSLPEAGRSESYDLEEWIASNPSIIGTDIVIIGRQLQTLSGPLDLLAIDKNGNLIIVELKRHYLPREAIAQAIDYASDVANWSIDRIREACTKYTGKDLEDVLAESFPDENLDNLSINGNQRIILLGFGVDPPLERMVSWLSENYGLSLNAIVLHYARTANGEEILSRTMVISEDVVEQRVKSRKFQIPTSDEPGSYPDEELRELLILYLHQDLVTARRIRSALLPLCLRTDKVTREQLKQELVAQGEVEDLSKAGYSLTGISGQIGFERNDFLRQVIEYEYPNYKWEKDNYRIRNGYRPLIESILEELGNSNDISNQGPRR
jgi:hypothetical protein